MSFCFTLDCTDSDSIKNSFYFLILILSSQVTVGRVAILSFMVLTSSVYDWYSFFSLRSAAVLILTCLIYSAIQIIYNYIPTDHQSDIVVLGCAIRSDVSINIQMGTTISVDKHTSTLDQILELSPKLLGATQFEAASPQGVSKHIKIWKFYEDDERTKNIASLPINLSMLKNSPLQFNDSSCYVAITVTATGTSSKISVINDALRESITSAIRSLSPRGLRTSLSESKKTDSTRTLDFQLYMLNGKTASQNLKSHTFLKCFELQRLILGNSNILPIFFGGGVIRGKKLQKGSIIQLTLDDEESVPTEVRRLMENVGICKQIYYTSNQPTIINLLQFPSAPLIQISNPQKKVTSPPSLPISNLKIKPPMLNLALKPLQQARYQQIQDQITQGVINFDIRATHRHEMKMEHCENECSEISQGLYVSGEKVAKDLNTLKKHNIQYVVNCAADYCENWFQDQGITYMSFFLKDAQGESIECLFYRVIEFIQMALSKKKGVLVHCIQGISRSITMIIAYVIFTMKLDYKKAEAFVKQRRHVASPNNGFMVELIQFYKRLYEDYESLEKPRVFLVSSHCKQTPQIITARLLKYGLFDKKKNIGLDTRGAYIIQTSDRIYVWVGERCTGVRKEMYQKYIKQYTQILQKYQRAPSSIHHLNQGVNDQNLFALWKTQPSYEYLHNQYVNLFPNIEQGKGGLKPGVNRKLFSSEIEQEDEEKIVKQKLFIYPDHVRGLGVFEKQDLAYISLLVRETSDDIKIFVWKDRSLLLSQQNQDQYIQKVVDKHYPDADPIIQDQLCNQESDEFIDCFQ